MIYEQLNTIALLLYSTDQLSCIQTPLNHYVCNVWYHAPYTCTYWSLVAIDDDVVTLRFQATLTHRQGEGSVAKVCADVQLGTVARNTENL